MSIPTPCRAGLLALGLLAGTALAPAVQAQQPQPQPQQPPSRAGSAIASAPNFAGLVERVAPAVVRVAVVGHREAQAMDLPPQLRGSPLEEFFRRFGVPGSERAPQRQVRGQGSGFIIDPAGFVVSNNHVVGNADRVTIELPDGRQLPARVIGSDPQTDVALLKVEAEGDLPTVSWGDSDQLRVGEPVLAMGNPFGLGGTATSGIVSARGRQIGAGPYDDFIQTDASINPGNSGGPLFNLRGEVVGMNTAIFSPSGGNIGIGFAVPSAIARRVVEDLRDDGRVRRGWLGVSMQPLDQELAQALGLGEARGALIAGVQPGSPAARGGLRAGDLVIRAAGEAVETPRDLASAIGEAKPGQQVTLTLRRNGETRDQQVTLGERPDESQQAAVGSSRQEGRDSQALGLALGPVGDGPGAAVVRVAPGSVAAERGLRPGDVILRAGERDVQGPGDVARALQTAQQEGRPSVALRIRRGETSRFVALPLRDDQG